MTTPTREQVMQWMEQSGLGGFSMSDEITKLSTLARADLEATIAEQAAEIADYELAHSDLHKWRNKYRASISSEIEKANSLSRQLTAEQAKVAELEAIEANLCDLHNVALEQVADEQAKVKLLVDALTTVHESCFMVADHDQLCMKAIAEVKEK